MKIIENSRQFLGMEFSILNILTLYILSDYLLLTNNNQTHTIILRKFDHISLERKTRGEFPVADFYFLRIFLLFRKVLTEERPRYLREGLKRRDKMGLQCTRQVDILGMFIVSPFVRVFPTLLQNFFTRPVSVLSYSIISCFKILQNVLLSGRVRRSWLLVR